MMPDPKFPTVAFPNPEEGASALHEAFKHADTVDAPLIFANDPDADRFNLAELQRDGSWRVFNGNEIAAIFADALWRQHQSLPTANDYAMLNSCVSSKLIKAMGLQEGFAVHETFTGFKYLANKAIELENSGTRVLMAYEEAIGYMINGRHVPDKDGISALLLALYVAAEARAAGRLFSEILDGIYAQYGYFAQHNGYYLGEGVDFSRIFKAMRDKLRSLLDSTSDSLHVPTGGITIKGHPIYSIQDYPGTNMITFYLDAQGLSWLSLRTSGTEPKVKFYSELPAMGTSAADKRRAAEHLSAIVLDLCTWFLEPKLNNLSLPTI
jgi:phosphomannomutase